MGILSDLQPSLARPEELLALVRFLRKAKRARAALIVDPPPPPLPTTSTATSTQQQLQYETAVAWAFAYRHLKLVSRSFALVIMELEKELRDPVCVFYLVLRALDTVEDDTTVDAQKRVKDCIRFYQVFEHYQDYTPPTSTSVPQHEHEKDTLDLPPLQYWMDYGKGNDNILMKNIMPLITTFTTLKQVYRDTILEIARRMGKGMADHILDTENVSITDYDLYCHYVAGLVGIGLSKMFVDSHREDPVFVQDEVLSNSMGLFLQKANIVRDYLEDCRETRTFWPREIWSLYTNKDNGALTDFTDLKNLDNARLCLNHMVTDALRHVADCLVYMQRVKDPYVFAFVAIPQVMALATLTECYNNPLVFQKVVKIRKGLTAKIFLDIKNIHDLHKIYYEYALRIVDKADFDDPTFPHTRDALANLVALVEHHLSPQEKLRASRDATLDAAQFTPALKERPLNKKKAAIAMSVAGFTIIASQISPLVNAIAALPTVEDPMAVLILIALVVIVVLFHFYGYAPSPVKPQHVVFLENTSTEQNDTLQNAGASPAQLNGNAHNNTDIGQRKVKKAD